MGEDIFSGPNPTRHAHNPSAMHCPLPQQSRGQRRMEQSPPSQPASQTQRPWKQAPWPEQPLTQSWTRWNGAAASAAEPRCRGAAATTARSASILVGGLF